MFMFALEQRYSHARSRPSFGLSCWQGIWMETGSLWTASTASLSLPGPTRPIRRAGSALVEPSGASPLSDRCDSTAYQMSADSHKGAGSVFVFPHQILRPSFRLMTEPHLSFTLAADSSLVLIAIGNSSIHS